MGLGLGLGLELGLGVGLGLGLGANPNRNPNPLSCARVLGVELGERRVVGGRLRAEAIDLVRDRLEI